MIKKIISVAVLCLLLTANAQAQSSEKQIVKVDFDFSGRRVEEVGDPNYNSWPITEQTEAEKSFNNVTFKLKGNFSSKWFKTGMSAPFYSRLTSDGLFTDKSLELTISGLKAGQHSVLTFHNTFDKIEGKTFAPIKIYVDNKLVETVIPTNRETSTIGAATAYIEFKAQAGKNVVIRFELDSKAPDLIQQMVINGFEIDTPNLKKQAHTPKP